MTRGTAYLAAYLVRVTVLGWIGDVHGEFERRTDNRERRETHCADRCSRTVPTGSSRAYGLLSSVSAACINNKRVAYALEALAHVIIRSRFLRVVRFRTRPATPHAAPALCEYHPSSHRTLASLAKAERELPCEARTSLPNRTHASLIRDPFHPSLHDWFSSS